jgi:hypothetical protein
MEAAGDVATIDVPRSAVASARRRERIFYTSMSVAMALAVVYGFARSYYFKAIYGTPALPALYHVHGVLFTAWIGLLVVQTSLVAAGRTPLHRRLGVAGGVLAAAMTIAAVAMTRALGLKAPSDPAALAFLVVPFATAFLFPGFVGAALWWRRFPQTHKRLMLLATLELVPAGIGRWPILATAGPLGFFGLTTLFVVAMAVYDRTTTGRLHPATLWGGLILIASQWLRVPIGNTPQWQEFARWIVS